ncbi:MAG: aminotransferase class I/II-fold pyridoxal phosphate-dependent enzyme [Planctomycetaceae bacterium]|jgi:7-keto-8-aminopelargonate synthetase-like enzyme/acyl-CoA synthetase (AMP-forming)/AMP-acid ligase II/acyl carrier protein|nr:aminotransferase class I/II-fold pyridoxal phosphate-dependent enzyme [Planctomycetaceae bacterium]
MNLSTLFGPDNLVQLVQYQALVQPDKPAFIYLPDGADNEIVLTNAELDRRVKSIAAHLQRQNLFGERALLLYPPGLEFIIAYFACLYAGVIAVPLYPPRKNRAMLRIQMVEESAKAKIVLATADIIARSATMLDDTPALKALPWIATDSAVSSGTCSEDDWTMPPINSETLAFLQYTSGSTGDPKGVMLTHGNLLHNSHLIHQGFEHTRTDVGVYWLPSYHDMGLIGGIIQPLYCGRPNIFMPPLTFLTRPFRWLKAITKYKGTTSGGPNFAYDVCIRQIKEEQLDELDLSSWKVAFNGAEPVLAETMEAFARKFERCGFRYEAFYPCFGLAEGTLIVSGGFVAEKPVVKNFDAAQLAKGLALEVVPPTAQQSMPLMRRLVSNGHNILPEQHVAIAEPETCVELPDGQIGEIWVSGPSVAQGYWERPDITEYTFHATMTQSPYPAHLEVNWMRTGDLGFLLNGELFVTGRIKDLLIIRGVNIYPQDIERTVQKVAPVLRPLCGAAVMVPDAHKEKLVIIQEVDRKFKGDNPDENVRLFSAICKAVAAEHEVPAEGIALIQQGTIPKTSSGKIQHFACRDGYLNKTLSEVVRWNGEPLPKLEEAEITARSVSKDEKTRIDGTSPQPLSFVSPKSQEKKSAVAGQFLPLTQEAVADAVLEEVRRIGKERAANVSLETDITELGLDSLERMEIIAALEDRFGGQFPESVLPTLFTAQQVLDAVLQYLGTGTRKRYYPRSAATPESIETIRERLRKKFDELAVPLVRVPFSPEKFEELFGKDHAAETPVGIVKIGDNQYQKLAAKDTEHLLWAMKQTFIDPVFVVKEKRDSGEATLFLKSFIDNPERDFITIMSVTLQMDDIQVSVSTHQRKNRQAMDKIADSAEVLYEKGIPTETGQSGYNVNSPSPRVNSQEGITSQPVLSSDTAGSQGGIYAETTNFSLFPEYQKLKIGLDLMAKTGLNRFFDVHEGITNNIALIGGKEYINFSNYNYVNTSGDPEVSAAAVEAIKKYGTSVSASRLVSGNKPIHQELENEISDFLGTEDTIVMVGGHSTNEGVIGHLLNDQDMILYDSLSHNSITQGVKLSGARRRPFPHNDWKAADWILQNHRGQYRRVLIAVEGLYSMDGDYPDLPKLIEVKKKHGCLLMVDEAHSLGTLGKTGRGIGEHFNVNRSDVDIWMCTLSKTFASVGGYISGSKELVEYLKYTSPNFVFSVGISPPMGAAALAAIRLLKREPQRTQQAQKNGQLFLKLAKEKGLDTGVSMGNVVVPVIIGNSMKALQASNALFERSINVQPILHPAVEEKAARLRFFITSAHTEEQIRYTVDTAADVLR